MHTFVVSWFSIKLHDLPFPLLVGLCISNIIYTVAFCINVIMLILRYTMLYCTHISTVSWMFFMCSFANLLFTCKYFLVFC